MMKKRISKHSLLRYLGLLLLAMGISTFVKDIFVYIPSGHVVQTYESEPGLEDNIPEGGSFHIQSDLGF